MMQSYNLANGISNAISNGFHIVARHATNLCVDSKISTVFRTTVSAAQAHPYIAILGTGVAVVYCCRGQIGSLVNKVNQAAQFLYTKATGSMISLMNLLRRHPASLENPKKESNLETTKNDSNLETTKDESNSKTEKLPSQPSISSTSTPTTNEVDANTNTEKTGTDGGS